MKRLAASATLLAAALIGAPAARGASVAGLVQEGNRLYREGRFSAALEKYRQAESMEPGNAALHYNIGNVLYRQGEYEKAYEQYRLAFPARERDLAEGARFNAGNAHFARRNWQDAIRNYKEALQLDPTDRDAKKNLELALLNLREEQQRQQQPQAQPQDQNDDQDRDQQDQQPPQQDRDQRQKEAPRPDAPPRDRKSPEEEKQSLSRQEAMRILNAMRDQDRPPREALKVPPPDRRPERDW